MAKLRKRCAKRPRGHKDGFRAALTKLRLLLVDACALIDFAKSDTSVITLASRYVGEVHVATPVFEEVHDLDPAMAASLGIKLFEPPLEMLAAAAAQRGRLSFQDRLCVLAAKAKGWTCVSNDRRSLLHGARGRGGQHPDRDGDGGPHEF